MSPPIPPTTRRIINAIARPIFAFLLRPFLAQNCFMYFFLEALFNQYNSISLAASNHDFE
jgi:hypothetical protein